MRERERECVCICACVRDEMIVCDEMSVIFVALKVLWALKS